jgi:hypothetical protein
VPNATLESENFIEETVCTVTVAVPFGIVAKPVIGAKPTELSLEFTADIEI